MLSLTALTRRAVQEPCPPVSPPVAVPTSQPLRQPARPARVFRLYPEPPKPAAVQARALLQWVCDECPEAAGQWVLVADLSRAYAELASRERWALLHWNRLGKELAKLTSRKSVKRAGRRYVAYEVPTSAL